MVSSRISPRLAFFASLVDPSRHVHPPAPPVPSSGRREQPSGTEQQQHWQRPQGLGVAHQAAAKKEENEGLFLFWNSPSSHHHLHHHRGSTRGAGKRRRKCGHRGREQPPGERGFRKVGVDGHGVERGRSPHPEGLAGERGVLGEQGEGGRSRVSEGLGATREHREWS